MEKGKQECQNGKNNLSKQQNVYQNGKKYAHGQSFQLLLSHIHKSVKSNNAVILSAKLLFFFHISKQFDLFYQHYICLYVR